MNYTNSILNRYIEALRDASEQGCVPLATVRFAFSMALRDVDALITGQADTLTRQAEKIARLEAENERLAAAKPVMVDSIDEVDYPPVVTIKGNGATSAISTPTPNGSAVTQTSGISWHGLPHDLQAQITRLEDGEVTWRNLPTTDRRAITLYVLPRLGDTTLTMGAFDFHRPAWMPTPSALTQMFGLRWTEIVEQANRVAEDV